MKKSLALLRKGFVSSSGTTPEFLAFYRTFKKEWTAMLTVLGCTKIEIDKGHFYVSGFFTTKEGKIYYFSLSDVRSFREDDMHFGSLMYRTALHYKDYTGGRNQYVPMALLAEAVVTGDEFMPLRLEA